MSKESSDPNIAESTPRFIPSVKEKKFTHSRLYDRLRYLVRLPLANSFTRGITLLCACIVTTNTLAYFWKGSEHPLNRYRWNRMKERGELSSELLEKERLLSEYVVDKWRNPPEPLPRVKFFR
uniref:NADH dehydrogenase [ubiquinone] 1 beta subcomplex subunit 4 n=1 Tax=Panagrolaimus sp. ES5 TaxID=591445 RepID=A0AC34FFU1_9BILA